MVGVPGRSKGCQTCRKRRIKCDEARPRCARCLKAGYQCAGYERKLEIREYTYAKVGDKYCAYTSRSTSPAPPCRTVVFHLNPIATDEPDPAGTVPRSLSLIAFKDEMQFSFVIDSSVWRTYGWPWLELSAQGKLGSLALDACRSFAQTVFGRYYSQKDIELQGMSLYGATVQSLSKELDRPADQLHAETLITPILMLLMYATARSDRQASYFHVVGLDKVMQYSNPSRFSRMPYRLAFESARSTLFTVSLVLKQRCFLDQPQWKSEPWGGLPKSPQNQLVDILVNLPGYLQDLAEIDRDILRQQALVERLEADLVVLEDFGKTWATNNPLAVHEVLPSTVAKGALLCPSRVPNAILWFRNFAHSTEFILYNAVLICTLAVLAHVSTKEYRVHSLLASVNGTSEVAERMSVRSAAIQICRAFEFQLVSIASSREPSYFWLLPLGVASRILHTNTIYRRWVEEMLAASKNLKSTGSDTSEFAFGYWSFLEKVAGQSN